MRLFAALPLSEAAIERLTSLRLRLSGPNDGLRWSEPEQWHITLQFYGQVEEQVAICIRSHLAKVATVAPEIVLEKLGLFAAKGILFVAVDPLPSLLALQQEVLAQSRMCGIVPESRPFRPHITMARSKGKTGDRVLRQLSTPTPPAFGAPVRWRPKECLLLESVLSPQGAKYLVRSRCELEDGSRQAEERP